MRKTFVAIMASLLSFSSAFAFFPEAVESYVEVGAGYRSDTFKWGTNANPFGSGSGSSSYFGADGSSETGLRSQLKWDDLSIWLIEGRGRYITCDNIYLRGSIDYGWITSGKVHDRDFFVFEDAPSREFSHTRADTKGHVYDAKIAVGYQFRMCDDSFSISPLIGYSWRGQHFELKNLHDEFLNSDSSFSSASSSSRSFSSSYSSYYDSYSSGSSSGSDRLHSKYNTRWDGIFIGFDLDYRLNCDWTIFLDYEYHWATYHAKGRWNLREDLPNGFNHHSKNAWGNVLDIGVQWDLCEWTLALRGEFQYFRANKGHDRALYFEENLGNIKNRCYVTNPLSKVEWTSAGVYFDVGMSF